MAKKVLSKIKNKKSLIKINKANFLVLFFVLGFSLMIIPLIRPKASDIASLDGYNWFFDFSVGSLSSQNNISLSDDAASLEEGKFYGFLESNLFNLGESASWDKILLDIEIADDYDLYREDFSTSIYNNIYKTTANWDTYFGHVTQPTSWTISSDSLISYPKISGNNIAWVYDNEIWKCNLDLNSTAGGCLEGDAKTLIYSGSRIQDYSFDISTNFIVWVENRDLCIYNIYDESSPRCIAGLSLGSGNEPRISGDLVVYRNNSGGINIFNIADDSIIYSDLSPLKLKPCLSGSYVSWMEDGRSAVLKNINSGDSSIISSGITSQVGDGVIVSGNNVVWSDTSDPSNIKLYLHSIDRNTNIEIDSSVDIGYGLSGDLVAYTKGNIIYVYKISSGAKRLIYKHKNILGLKDISGSRIVYSDTERNLGIVQFDDIFNVSNYQGGFSDIQSHPSVDGNRVVWQDGRGIIDISDGRLLIPGRGADGMDIYLANLDEGWERRVTSNDNNQIRPDIAGNYIVWEDLRHDVSISEIYLCDISKDGNEGGCLSGDNKTRITEDSVAPQKNSKVFGDYVVWSDLSDFSIKGYRISTGDLFNITGGATDGLGNISPSIHNNKVIWVVFDGDLQGIFSCNLNLNGEPGGCYESDTKNEVLALLSNDDISLSPDIYGEYVVWHSPEGIYLTRLDGSLIRVGIGRHEEPPVLISGLFSYPAKIFGDYIAWDNNLFYIPSWTKYSFSTDNFLNLTISERYIVGDYFGSIKARPMIKFLEGGLAQSENILNTAVENLKVRYIAADERFLGFFSGISRIIFSVDEDNWDNESLGGPWRSYPGNSEGLYWKKDIRSSYTNFSQKINSFSFEYDYDRVVLDLCDESCSEIYHTFYDLVSGRNEINISSLGLPSIFKMRLRLYDNVGDNSPILNDWRLSWAEGSYSDCNTLSRINLISGKDTFDGEEMDTLQISAINNCGGWYTVPTNVTLSLSENDLGGFILSDGSVDSMASVSLTDGIGSIDFKSKDGVSGRLTIRACAGGICGDKLVEIRSGKLKVFLTTSGVSDSSMGDPRGFTSGDIWFEDYTGTKAADMICQAHANYISLSGRYRAWLSADSYSPATSWRRGIKRYELPNDSLVANNFDNLISSTTDNLTNSISIGADGDSSGDAVKVFTATGTDGTGGGSYCDSWTSDSDSIQAIYGSSGSVDGNWTNYDVMRCDSLGALYCFEQESETREVACDLPSAAEFIGSGRYIQTCVAYDDDDSCVSWPAEIVSVYNADSVCGFRCVPNSTWNSTSESCHCNSGYTWDGSICSSGSGPSLDTCPDGEEYNSEFDRCVPICVGDYTLNDEGTACVIGSTPDTDPPGPGPTPDPVSPGSGPTPDPISPGSGSSSTPTKPVGGGGFCGDGLIDPDEECDGDKLDGMRCRDFNNFIGGKLACGRDCTFDFSGCYSEVKFNNMPQVVLSVINDNIIEPVSKAYTENISKNKPVQTINKSIIAPLITTIAAINLANALPVGLLALSFLQYLLHFLNVLFTEPTYVFTKKRDKWGTIYDSISKEPLALAVVRLYDVKTGKLEATRVTDRSGRYYFMGDPKKTYKISVKMNEYKFPADKESLEKDDPKIKELYRNPYFGEEIKLTDGSKNIKSKNFAKGLINLDVPLDINPGLIGISGYTKKIKSKLTTWEEYRKASTTRRNAELERIMRQAKERRISNFIAFFGFSVTVISLIISPSFYLFGLFILHSLLLITFIFFAKRPPAKPWGHTLDKDTKKGIGQAIVRLFDDKHGRLLMTQVTDGSGRYGFLTEIKNKYFLIGDKDNYEMIKERIEVESSEKGLVKEDIWLKKKNKK